MMKMMKAAEEDGKSLSQASCGRVSPPPPVTANKNTFRWKHKVVIGEEARRCRVTHVDVTVPHQGLGNRDTVKCLFERTGVSQVVHGDGHMHVNIDQTLTVVKS